MENSALTALASDVKGLDALRRAARDNSPEALKEAAKQFEAMFLQVVIKSMREASSFGGEDLFGGQEGKMYQDMLDKQWAQVIAEGGGTGLSRVLERQLSANARSADTTFTPELKPLSDVPVFQGASRWPAADSAGKRQSLQSSASGIADLDAALSAISPSPGRDVPEYARAFVERVWPAAVSASRETGIPARFLVAQAALETGWGRSELTAADGTPSRNLFNIKTGGNWSGGSVTVAASEYIDGRWVKQTDAFRSYGSYEESFADYARLLKSQPRYQGVLGTQDAGSFARGLQQAGYATDPAYADKLQRIINGPMLRAALSG
ncbi:flagellar assembly peptidoglycan hydrolase FlgJ [Methyloversatilis thermotolerans]|uniref:flagellar assembly peptidoglycan hydrolase FlgJ n=1 Tax=Methyloversatilis thermotolerans TaxID=1346290 RepID=UPI0003650C0D|nr:flagellar assembly peptidoglycan hydrolase FlgJ [Methyloversatilis thermotolerans]